MAKRRHRRRVTKAPPVAGRPVGNVTTGPAGSPAEQVVEPPKPQQPPKPPPGLNDVAAAAAAAISVGAHGGTRAQAHQAAAAATQAGPSVAESRQYRQAARAQAGREEEVS